MLFETDKYKIEAWIEYIGQAGNLPEHREEQKSDLRDGFITTKSYLEMKEGKQFRIAIRFHRPIIRDKAYQIQVYIDGRDFHAHIHPKSSEDNSQTFYRSRVDSMIRGRAMSGALHFASLELTSDEREADIRGHDLNELSSLVVQIQEGETRVCYNCATLIPTDTAHQVGKVHESKMKLGVTVSGKDFQPRPAPTSCVHFYPDAQTPKVCAFVWKNPTRSESPTKLSHASRIRAERRDRLEFQKRHGLPLIPEQDEKPVPGGSGRKKRLHPMDYYDDEESDDSDEEDDTLITPKKAKIIEMIDLTGDDAGDDEVQAVDK